MIWGAKISIQTGDVRNAKEVEQAVRNGIDAFGTIDILFNNAGICAYGYAHELTEEECYYMTKTGYFSGVSVVIVNSQREDIKSVNDLKGKKIGLSIGDSHTRVIEDWNRKNGSIPTLLYYDDSGFIY